MRFKKPLHVRNCRPLPSSCVPGANVDARDLWAGETVELHPPPHHGSDASASRSSPQSQRSGTRAAVAVTCCSDKMSLLADSAILPADGRRAQPGPPFWSYLY